MHDNGTKILIYTSDCVSFVGLCMVLCCSSYNALMDGAEKWDIFVDNISSFFCFVFCINYFVCLIFHLVHMALCL